VLSQSGLLGVLPARANDQSFELANQAMRLYRQDMISDAEKSADQALSLNPQLAEAHYVKGIIAYYKQKNNDLARTELDRALALNPRLVLAYADRADLEWTLKEKDKSLADLNAAISLAPTQAIYSYVRGTRYFDMKKNELALADFTHAIQLNANDADIYNARGQALSELKRFEEALVDTTHALQIKTTSVFLNNRGWIYHDLKKYAEAKVDFDRALSLDAKNGRAYKGLGFCYMDQGQYEKALPLLSKWLSFEPSAKVMGWKSTGDCYYKLKKYPQAAAEFSKAIQALPKDAELYNYRGVIMSAAGEHEKALADFEKAIALSPNPSSKYLSNRGVERRALGNEALARKDFEKALALNPKDVEAQKGLGLADESAGAPTKALARYTEALRLDPTNVPALRARGRVYFKLERYKDAYSDFAKATQVAPNDAEFWIGRSDCASGLWDFEKSLQDSERALKIECQNKPSSYWSNVKINALTNIAIAEIHLGQAQKALDTLKELDGLDKDKFPNSRLSGAINEKKICELYIDAPNHNAEYARTWGQRSISLDKTETTPHLWALACTGLLTEKNKERHDILCLTAETPESSFKAGMPMNKWWSAVFKAKYGLAKFWGINSREDLLGALNNLAFAGHRASFDAINQFDNFDVIDTALDLLPDERRQEAQQSIAIARENFSKLGDKSLSGWDYCRYIYLCREGVLCSYLTEDEAWEKIMPVAHLLQNQFTSWSDLGTNYLIGRKFWQPQESEHKTFEKNYQMLLNDSSSPWVKISWSTHLDDR
jgi:tetratricopeptide (TPR) repeat protein